MKESTSNVAVKSTKRAAKRGKVQVDWTSVVTIGIDVGDRFSYYCAIDDAGVVVGEGRVGTTAGSIELELGKLPRKTIAIEAGMHSPWISRLLTRLGHEVLVANPRKLRLIYENRRKNDRVDAEYLARVARLDPKLLGAITHRSESGQSHIEIIRARDVLVRTRVRLIQHVRSANWQKSSFIVGPGVSQARGCVHARAPWRHSAAADRDHRAAHHAHP